LLFNCRNLKAQNDYYEGTTWYYGFITHGFSPFLNYVPQSLTIDGDTIIGGQHFQRIVKLFNSSVFDIQTPFSVEYIRREGDKIFWFNQQNGNISILYNFAAVQGESWKISINDCELLVVVDSVNYYDYNDILKKNIYVTDYFTDFEGREYVGNCFKGKIIEDIGHTATFFPHLSFFLCNGIQIDGSEIAREAIDSDNDFGHKNIIQFLDIF
jgi:hypothetical protein